MNIIELKDKIAIHLRLMQLDDGIAIEIDNKTIIITDLKNNKDFIKLFRHELSYLIPDVGYNNDFEISTDYDKIIVIDLDNPTNNKKYFQRKIMF